eukprot:TRINITY_DN2005_c1_g1_i1.p1 TRINITY_DN2005_c1_g1~~TRINITY_DN2005_c1_g1_i1.p1  ORF type:complete len:210 (+),score=-2.35 TRINITY_DN2005_c1_g1_i1:193-822(+)
MAFLKLLVLIIAVHYCTAQQCSIIIQYNAKGDFVQQSTAYSATECCSKCASNSECNTFTYCPRYPHCRNGNNPIPQYRCDLKYQQKVANWQQPDYWSKGSGVDFESGYIAGKGKPTNQCSIKYGGNAKGDVLGNEWADSIDMCCQKCKDNWKCNVFVYCPHYNGCYNNGQTLPYQMCDLKYQYKVSQYQEPDYYRTGMDFHSGYILGKP